LTDIRTLNWTTRQNFLVMLQTFLVMLQIFSAVLQTFLAIFGNYQVILQIFSVIRQTFSAIFEKLPGHPPNFLGDALNLLRDPRIFFYGGILGSVSSPNFYSGQVIP
jgi:hypothetical protein